MTLRIPWYIRSRVANYNYVIKVRILAILPAKAAKTMILPEAILNPFLDVYMPLFNYFGGDLEFRQYQRGCRILLENDKA